MNVENIPLYTMRKEQNKFPKTKHLPQNPSEYLNRCSFPSNIATSQIPVFKGVDDEEYFFEVEDF